MALAVPRLPTWPTLTSTSLRAQVEPRAPRPPDVPASGRWVASLSLQPPTPLSQRAGAPGPVWEATVLPSGGCPRPPQSVAPSPSYALGHSLPHRPDRQKQQEPHNATLTHAHTHPHLHAHTHSGLHAHTSTHTPLPPHSHTHTHTIPPCSHTPLHTHTSAHTHTSTLTHTHTLYLHAHTHPSDRKSVV